MLFELHFLFYMLLGMLKIYVNFNSLNIQKLNNKKFPPQVLMCWILLCAPVHRIFVLYKKFQVASVYNINVEYEIWCFCCNFFLSYADNKHKTHIHSDQMLKRWFSDSGNLETCKSIKISISKIWPKSNIFSTITWLRESKKYNFIVGHFPYPY